MSRGYSRSGGRFGGRGYGGHGTMGDYGYGASGHYGQSRFVRHLIEDLAAGHPAAKDVDNPIKVRKP